MLALIVVVFSLVVIVRRGCRSRWGRPGSGRRVIVGAGSVVVPFAARAAGRARGRGEIGRGLALAGVFVPGQNVACRSQQENNDDLINSPLHKLWKL